MTDTLARPHPPIHVTQPLSPDELDDIHAWWRAANYLSVGQIYLLDNPLLRRDLVPRGRQTATAGTLGDHARAELHLRAPQPDHPATGCECDLPGRAGHGGPAAVASAYLDGTYSEVYPHITRDTEGLRKLFRQFSFPGGIPSHVAPETPGSIHEGGELGYVLSHAYGAAFDNPDLLVAAVVGDGEFETGPLAASWHANKFIDPLHDGAVLPILHLNGWKIANPTIPARIRRDELRSPAHRLWARGLHRRGRRPAQSCIRPWPPPWTLCWNASGTSRPGSGNGAKPNAGRGR